MAMVSYCCYSRVLVSLSKYEFIYLSSGDNACVVHCQYEHLCDSMSFNDSDSYTGPDCHRRQATSLSTYLCFCNYGSNCDIVERTTQDNALFLLHFEYYQVCSQTVCQYCEHRKQQLLQFRSCIYEATDSYFNELQLIMSLQNYYSSVSYTHLDVYKRQ